MRKLIVTSASIAIIMFGVVSTPAAAAASYPPGPGLSGTPLIHVSAEFQPAGSGAVALSHNPDLIPVGARATVSSLSTAAGTVALLTVRGVVPHHEYGAHVHVGTCGEDPLASGPHYQHVADPVQPSVDPAYANPRNEIWLDFRADAAGNGVAVAAVRWAFDDRPAGAVVLHEHFTLTGPGEAGVAGARVGCVTVPFAP